MSGSSSKIELSVVVPAYNAARTLDACLSALVRSADPRVEIIVVDDASTDGSRRIISKYPVRTIELPVNRWRCFARNRGVDAAHSDCILFVDADVVVHPDTLRKARHIFAQSPHAHVFFGSYDDRSQGLGLVGDYRNLLHHFTHQRSGNTAAHFWSGLGGIRRPAFHEVGGFDESRRNCFLEDVELGVRLVESGQTIYVAKDMQATHLKSYSLLSMIESDLFARALPWATLILERGLALNPHVVSPQRIFSAIGASSAIALLAAPILGTGALAFAASGLIAFLLANGGLLRFIAAKRGSAFAAICVPLHLAHTGCAVMGMAMAISSASWRRLRRWLARPANKPRIRSTNRSAAGP